MRKKYASPGTAGVDIDTEVAPAPKVPGDITVLSDTRLAEYTYPFVALALFVQLKFAVLIVDEVNDMPAGGPSQINTFTNMLSTPISFVPLSPLPESLIMVFAELDVKDTFWVAKAAITP